MSVYRSPEALVKSCFELKPDPTYRFCGITSPQVDKELEASFSIFTEEAIQAWVEEEEPDENRNRRAKGFQKSGPEVVSSLLEYTRPNYADLLKLSRGRQTQHKWLKTCFLRAVSSADNPFLPGMALSVALAEAGENAAEGERKKIVSLGKSIEALLLEILERLPQTVLGFENAMSGCSAMLEPDRTEHQKEFPGPLSLALSRKLQTETFCTAPLVIDYLSRIFARGLPNWRDSDRILRDAEELRYLDRFTQGLPSRNTVIDFLISNNLEHLSSESDYEALRHLAMPPRQEESLFISDRYRKGDLQQTETETTGRGSTLHPGAQLATNAIPFQHFLQRRLQGAEHEAAEVGGHDTTLFPGVQFIAAGLLAKPRTYYEVPVMRMVLDLAVYLGMLVFFSFLVLLHEDGTLNWGEIVFSVHLVVSENLAPGLRVSYT